MLRFAYVMDPLEGIGIDQDTTFSWLLEAQARGHENYFIGPGGVALWEGEARGRAAPLSVRRVRGDHFELGEFSWTPLREFDAVFMRKDPPVDLEYLYSSYLLCHVPPPTLVLNDPYALREANEKLYALQFPDLVPPTLVTGDVAEVRAFLRAQGGKAVLKPLHGAGGEGVVILGERDPNLTALLEMSTAFGRRTVMAQRYLPEAVAGDKRVIVIGGDPVGAVLRVPSGEGEHRGNIHVGGRCEKTTLTEREQRACVVMRDQLLADGLHFVGLDFIGDWLTEVNYTSPTGVQEIGALDGVDLSAQWIDYVEALVAARRS